MDETIKFEDNENFDDKRSPLSGPTPKNRNKAPSGLDGVEKKLYYVIQDHSTVKDDKLIKKIFNKYSYAPKSKSGDEDSFSAPLNREKELTEENAYMAVQEVLKTWNVDLDTETDSRFYS